MHSFRSSSTTRHPPPPSPSSTTSTSSFFGTLSRFFSSNVKFAPQSRGIEPSVRVMLTPDRTTGHRRSGRLEKAGQPYPVDHSSIRTAANAELHRLLVDHETISFPRGGLLNLLTAPLARCDFSFMDDTPTMNAVAGSQEMYRDRILHFQDWSSLRSTKQQIKFLLNLEAQTTLYPQCRRILMNETDAKETYSFNVILPLIPILNSFIDEEYRANFEVQVFSEYAKKVDYSVQPIRIDYGLYLVERGSRQGNLRKMNIRIPLVIIEAKRHDLVQAEEWIATKREGPRQLRETEHAKAQLLPQLLIVQMLENLPYRLLRHHTLDINKSAIEETRETVQLAFRVVGDALKGEAGEHRSVYSFGPRLALCFDVCEAIRALGIALSEFYPSERPQLASALQGFLDRRHGRHGEGGEGQRRDDLALRVKPRL